MYTSSVSSAHVSRHYNFSLSSREVHMADLIGAQEGNPDENPDDPTKIHWGKFNIMGKFISSITQFQAQCKDAPNYAFPERPNIQNLLLKDILMSEEVGYFLFPILRNFNSASCIVTKVENSSTRRRRRRGRKTRVSTHNVPRPSSEGSVVIAQAHLLAILSHVLSGTIR